MNTALREHRRRLLRQLINEHAGGQVNEFALLVGIKSPSQLSQYLGDHRALGDGTARKIETALGLPQGFFDFPARGAKTKPDGDEAGTISNVPAPPAPVGRQIPLLYKAPAGPWMEELTQHENNNDLVESWLPAPPTACGPDTYALRVQGESMTSESQRSYPNGSFIYVDPSRKNECAPGHAVIARLVASGEIVFKILAADAGRQFLRSLHRSYPVIHEPFEIVGQVIGTYMPENV